MLYGDKTIHGKFKTSQPHVRRHRSWLCCGTDGADLVVPDPNASVRRGGGGDPQPSAGGDHGLLQFTNIPAKALRGATAFSPHPSTSRAAQPSPDLPEVAQLEDGVADQLTRPMEGDETPSGGLVNLGPQQPQLLQQGCRVRLLTNPSGVNRRVLAQQEGMSWTGTMPLHIHLLELHSLQVGDQAQADHLHNWPAHLDLEHREPGHMWHSQKRPFQPGTAPKLPSFEFSAHWN